MVIEYKIPLGGESHPVIISDEPSALLAAKAAGRAFIGVETDGNKWDIRCARYVIPGFEDANRELAELVLRRHLGLPWTIDTTRRLVIREFEEADADQIPEEEYGPEEAMFRSRDMMADYIEKQYGFYEYGTWALTEKDSGVLVGMAGVSNPRLPEHMEMRLEAKGDSYMGEQTGEQDPQAGAHGLPWLELGYHIFRPYRRLGYASEAAAAIQSYTHQVLEARLCALIDAKNQASRAVAEGLGMKCIMGTDIQSSEGLLLYAESWIPQPDRADP